MTWHQIIGQGGMSQHTGSFKLRGASNAVWILIIQSQMWLHFRQQSRARRGTRRRQPGLQATIVMPKDSPVGKIEGTKAYGASVILYERYRSREEIGADLAARKQAHLIKPYDDVWVIAGQGTVGWNCAQAATKK